MKAGIAVTFVIFGIAATIIAGFIYLSYLNRPESQSAYNLTKQNNEVLFSLTAKKDRWITPNVYVEPDKIVAVGCGKSPCTVCVGDKCVKAKIKDEDFFVQMTTGNAEAVNTDINIANYELLQVKLDNDSFVETGAVGVLIKPHVAQKESSEPGTFFSWLWLGLQIIVVLTIGGVGTIILLNRYHTGNWFDF